MTQINIDKSRPLFTLTVGEWIELNQIDEFRKVKSIEQTTQKVHAEGDDIWNIKQVADYTGYAGDTIYGMTSRREIPYFKIPGRKPLFFKKSLILEWIESGRRRTKKEIAKDAEKFVEKERRAK